MVRDEISVKLEDIVKKFSLEVLSAEQAVSQISVRDDDINRPGLPLTGFYMHFERTRIQIMGMLETALMEKYDPQSRKERFRTLFEQGIPAVIFTRGIKPFQECVDLSNEYGVPLLRTETVTSHFMTELNFYLKMSMAPSLSVHGTLMEVYSEGILIQGESGIGKSETAVELIKRGHRLVADDAVDIRRVSDNVLIGTAPKSIRHYVELRGIGIVNVRRAFGMGAVRMSERINLIVKFVPWENEGAYDRMGFMDTMQSEDILGISVPKFTVPVKSGRNLAVIIEVAAMNHRQNRMGLNAADELSEKIYQSMVNEILDR